MTCLCAVGLHPCCSRCTAPATQSLAHQQVRGHEGRWETLRGEGFKKEAELRPGNSRSLEGTWGRIRQLWPAVRSAPVGASIPVGKNHSSLCVRAGKPPWLQPALLAHVLATLPGRPAGFLAVSSSPRLARLRALGGGSRAGAASSRPRPAANHNAGVVGWPRPRASALSMSGDGATHAPSPHRFRRAPDAEVVSGVRGWGRNHGGPGGSGGAREARVLVARLQGLHRAGQPPGHQRQGPGWARRAPAGGWAAGQGLWGSPWRARLGVSRQGPDGSYGKGCWSRSCRPGRVLRRGFPNSEKTHDFSSKKNCREHASIWAPTKGLGGDAVTIASSVAAFP